MKPESQSRQLLGVTRSKAKMYEYSVAEEYHITIVENPTRLFRLTLGILGDVSVSINSELLNDETINEFREQLRFAAQFFDAYLQSQLDQTTDYYLLLLGSAAYYLCELPGSSSVLVKRIGIEHPDLGCLRLEELLLWLLQGDFSTFLDGIEGFYGEDINQISQRLAEYFSTGNSIDSLFVQIKNLREIAYLHGTPRQLLIADVISAIVKKRYSNSARNSLPLYSGLPIDRWSDALQKKSFIRELWPAQHLLGKHGVFKGKSAIVQMPTSAGKTKSTEIIIRSAFLSGRANVAVVVAPFRALCHEIKDNICAAFADESVFIDDPSDVYQVDFDVVQFLELGVGKKILVITPEKLTYLLRYSPELAKSIGLLIYDEGHQFDNGIRGVTYELLLSSLKTMISPEAQSILISAVIVNAVSIGEWLNGNSGEIIIGSNLSPTYRTIAFTSWMDQRGRLEFVDQETPDIRDFFVPRIIEQQQLQLKRRERKAHLFPDKSDGTSIALYLGIKLVANGSVAIFCGKKDTVTGLCNMLVDIYERGLQYLPPMKFSDQEEVRKLHFLHEGHFGANASITLCAKIGVFAHSGNTPYGLRVAIEYAMQKNLIKFVICTSTLAQGVNLPIRYLIVTSIYQAGQKIKIRDFHNLIGRAGRSGMHTEGSILFADPVVYDKRNDFNERWRWMQVKELLDPSNSERCGSTLLSIFDPWYSDNKRSSIHIEPLVFVNDYINDARIVFNLSADILSNPINQGFTYNGIEKQIQDKINIISSIESYLMAHWDDVEAGLKEEDIVNLAQGTLAYYLSNDHQKTQIIELFRVLANNISANLPEPTKRKAFGKMLYGVHDSIEIEKWVIQNLDELVACDNQETLLITLWPILYRKIQNKTFKKCDSETALLNLTLKWIQGNSFHILFEFLAAEGAKIIAGTQKRQIKFENVIEICEGALAYEGMLVIGALTEIIGLVRSQEEPLKEQLFELQKRLRYGLPRALDTTLYEIGFSDRIVAMHLSSALNVPRPYRKLVIEQIKQREKQLRELLSRYPSYFSTVLDRVMNEIIQL